MYKLALFVFLMAILVAAPQTSTAQGKSPPATKADLEALEARLKADIKALQVSLSKKIEDTRAEAKAENKVLKEQVQKLETNQEKTLKGLETLTATVKDIASAQKIDRENTKAALDASKKTQDEDRKILLEVKAAAEKALVESTAARIAAEKSEKSAEAARLVAEKSGKDSAAARAAAERAATDAAAARSAAEKALSLMEEGFRNAKNGGNVVNINIQPSVNYVPSVVYVDRPVYYYYPSNNQYYAYYYGHWYAYSYYPYGYSSYGYNRYWRWYC